MSLPQTLSAALEVAMNRYFALDEVAFASLADLEGRIIEIHFSGLNESLYLFPGMDGLMVLSDFDGEADTRLVGTPIALAQLSLAKNPADVLFSGDVKIEGDTRLGQQFKKILSQINIDWEEQLSQYVGDIVAHQLGNGVRKLSAWMQRNQQSANLDMGEYLQEESRLSPAAAEINHFIHQVDTLRQDTDRLQARINHLLAAQKEEKSA